MKKDTHIELDADRHIEEVHDSENIKNLINSVQLIYSVERRY